MFYKINPPKTVATSLPETVENVKDRQTDIAMTIPVRQPDIMRFSMLH